MKNCYKQSVLSYNNFLRQSRPEEDSMSIFTQSVSELQSALEATLRYAKVMNFGRAKIVIHHGTIDICIESSKEMST